MSVFTDIQTKSQGKAQSSNWWRTQLFQALFDMGLGADGVTPGTALTFKYDPEDDNKELMKFWDKYPMVYIYGESDEHFWGANVHYMRPELRKYGFTPAAPPQTIHKYLRTNVRSSMLVVPDSEWDDIGQIPSEQFHITTFGRDTAVPTSVLLKKGELV